MAYIDEYMETSDGSKKQIRVPSAKGGTDRTIYVNGSSSGYKLGQSNDTVYTKHGREVSSSLRDFVKNVLWELLFREGDFSPLFYCKNPIFYIIKVLKNNYYPKHAGKNKYYMK